MGTSQSSKGPGSDTVVIPPWVPDPPTTDPKELDEIPKKPTVVPAAKPRRFGSARRALGEFAKTGDTGQMRRGLRQYVQPGYSGSAAAKHRHGSTVITAGALWNVLAGIALETVEPALSQLDALLRKAQTSDDIMDVIIEVVRPRDGTQDAEIERIAIRDTLSDLLSRYPDTELSHLKADERAFTIERFTALTVFGRFQLDVGLNINQKAPNATIACSRLEIARDYVDEVVSAAFRSLHEQAKILESGRIHAIVSQALKLTFEVFEDYTQ